MIVLKSFSDIRLTLQYKGTAFLEKWKKNWRRKCDELSAEAKLAWTIEVRTHLREAKMMTRLHFLMHAKKSCRFVHTRVTRVCTKNPRHSAEGCVGDCGQVIKADSV